MATTTPIHDKVVPRGNYLKKGRLQDVITLITILAVDENLFRNEDSLKTSIRGIPFSLKSWIDIALEHPEFFRPDREVSVALLSRSYLPQIQTQQGHETRERLTVDQTQDLINVAVALHDKELARRQLNFTIWIPTQVALLAGLAAVINSAISSHLNASSIKPLQASLEVIKSACCVENSKRLTTLALAGNPSKIQFNSKR